MKKLLFLSFISASVFANDLTLYVVPSPKGLDWSSPKTLMMSAAKNKLSMNSHFMGHAWVELKCGEQHVFTGMMNENADYISKLIFEQKGLSIFYHSFPGRLETQDDVQKELAHYSKNGGMNFVSFKLNDNQCKRAMDYLDQYREKNVGRNFGVAHNPRFGEGANSSAFIVSFPDVLNILDQEMKEAWEQTLFIPSDSKNQEMNVVKLLMKEEWASDTEKKVKLSFWNLDKMYNWINEKVSQNKSGYSVLKKDNVSGIVIDKSYFPAPEEPIWRQQLNPVNAKETAVIVEPGRPPKNRK